MIRLTRPSIDESDIQAVADVLRSGYLVQGPQVRRFEQQVAGYVGTTEAVAVSNGTAALHLGLLALGVAPGDRVAVPAYSWPATANVVVLCGAEPVFVDIDPETFCMEPSQLDRALERSGGAAAVLPVHAFGGMADMVGIGEVAARHGVPIVEDAACALGAALNGIRAGRWGRVGCFSFHPRKSITTGEGGMVTTDDAALAERIERMRNHGASVSEERRHAGAKSYVLPEFNLLGFNYRMTDLQGAVGLVQLSKLDRFVDERAECAAYYRAELAGLNWLRLPDEPADGRHAWQAFVTYVDEAQAPMPRDAIMERLQAKGIATRPGTHAVHMLGHYRERFGLEPDDFPAARDCQRHTMAIPLHNRMGERDFAYVVEQLLSI